ncbi:MAG: prepilin peptidase [Epsilonproteobacteria bacterium]|nr:prepilin peptidase [Campylobacterota bacterium]
MNNYLYLAGFTLLGLLIGSFLNVLIVRIPKGESVVFPSSHCVKCNNKLKWWHNIPILSWLILGGKCYFCKEKISWQYPLIEALSAFIFALSYLKSETLLQALVVSLVFALLLALSAIDFKYKEVPDSLNLSALTLSIFSSKDIIGNFQNALLFAGAFTLLRFYLSFILKKEAMGEADIMIAATIGAMVGVKLGLFTIFLSAVLALIGFAIVAKRDYEMPYIPFLAMALFVVFVFRDYFSSFLEKLYG